MTDKRVSPRDPNPPHPMLIWVGLGLLAAGTLALTIAAFMQYTYALR